MARKSPKNISSLRKPLRDNWKTYSWCSTVLMIGIIGGFLILSQHLATQAQIRVSGTGIMVMIPVLFIALAIGIANAIILPFLLLKRRVPRAWKIIFIILFIPALLVSLGGLYSAINGIRETIKSQQSYQQATNEFQADEIKKYKEQVPTAISTDEAMKLLTACDVLDFYYTAQNEEPTNAERSVSGILSVYLGDGQYRIHIAERHEATLVPIAREAKSKCLGKPKLWHSGIYE